MSYTHRYISSLLLAAALVAPVAVMEGTGVILTVEVAVTAEQPLKI